MTRLLSPDEIRAIFAEAHRSQSIEVTRIRYKNKNEIRRAAHMPVVELLELISASHREGHQPGGDLEARLDDKRILIGNHDGLYWIEESKPNATNA